MADLTSEMVSRAKRAVLRVDVPEGFGSGFFVRSNGLAITNHHVVRGVRECQIRTFDGRVLTARVIVSDRRNDLAVIHSAQTPGSVSILRLVDCLPKDAEDVIAIGMPAELDFSVTRGIVSSANRRFRGRPLIQTDVAINGGSSGGPLLNLRGEVLGVCCRGYNSYQGLNFAVPATLAGELLSQAERLSPTTSWYCTTCGQASEPLGKYCDNCGVRRNQEEA